MDWKHNEMTPEQIALCKEFGQWLLDEGYLTKVEGVTIKHGKHGNGKAEPDFAIIERDYFVVYFENKHCRKWIPREYKGTYISVGPLASLTPEHEELMDGYK